MLPHDIIEYIANVADIDTRRKMGFLPRPLDPELLSLMGQKMDRVWSMQRRESFHIDNKHVFVCSCLFPLTYESLMSISYSVMIDTLTSKIFYECMQLYKLSCIRHDHLELGGKHLTWNNITVNNNAIDIKNPFTLHQIIDTFSCFSVIVTMTSYNVDIIRNWLKKDLS